MPWSLGSPAGEAVLFQECDLAWDWVGLCRGFTAGTFQLGFSWWGEVGRGGGGRRGRWGMQERRLRQRREFPNKRLPALEKVPEPDSMFSPAQM